MFFIEYDTFKFGILYYSVEGYYCIEVIVNYDDLFYVEVNLN